MTDYVSINRSFWDNYAPEWVTRGAAAWRASEPYWGIWETSEAELNLLPADLQGLDAIELGCGTGYVGRWLEQRGATVTAIDNSSKQLATAQQLAREHHSEIGFLMGNAEQCPLPNESADFLISEYGAAIWCDPLLWIPEAARLLRPGGQLIFLGNAPLAMVCTPDSGADVTETLQRSYFDLHAMDWSEAEADPGGIEFNLPLSRWIDLFLKVGLVLDEYLEIQAPEGDVDNAFGTPRAWARQFPAEHVFKLSKPARS